MNYAAHATSSRNQNPADYFYSAATHRSRGVLWPIFTPARIAALPDLRSGREVQCRCCLGREGNGQPSDSDCIPKSLAERNCGALGWQCTSRSPGSCDRLEPKALATVAE